MEDEDNVSGDDDVLAAAKELSSQQHKSVGEVISSLTRQAYGHHDVQQRAQWNAPLADAS